MKTKGIPFWERYLEHFVLGIAVLVLVGFTAMQFMGDPNSVDAPGVGKLGPGQVDATLEEKARAIAERISGPPPVLEQPKPVLETFEAMKASAVSPAQVLALASPRIAPAAGEALGGHQPFVVPKIAAPFNTMRRQYFDTLSAEIVEEHQDLKSVLPPAPPFDITWITAASTFNVADIKRQFGERGPNGEAPLPLRWYNNRVDIVDLKVEREELVNGKWVDSKLLEPIPGQMTVRPKMKGNVSAATRDEILWLVSDPVGRTSIIQPEFYAGAASAWEPPHEGQGEVDIAFDPNEDPAIAELKAKLERDRKERDRILALMKELNCPAEAPDRPSGSSTPPRPSSGGGSQPSGAPPGGDLGAAGAGGAGSRTAGGGSGSRVDNEPKCRTLRRRLKAFEARIARAEAELERLQPDVVQEVEEPEVEEEQEEIEILVWAHDINVQPGRTYRYRFTIEIYNPLFARKNDLIAEQQHMADKFALASEVSEWTEPITAQPPLRLFVTQARPASQTTGIGASGLGSAHVEIFRFRDGRWWLASFSVEPGDRIGGSKAAGRPGQSGEQIDFATDWFILDVVQNIAADNDSIQQGHGASVLLQSLMDSGRVDRRWPFDDYTDPERSLLRQEVRAADTASTVASR